MKKQLLKDALVWGFVLWLIGYILGIVLFFVVPASFIGWVLTPVGFIITIWILYKKIHAVTWQYFLGIALVWTAIAVICDYFLLVKVFKPADGYYKLDVYIYYISTFILPLFVGLRKNSQK